MAQGTIIPNPKFTGLDANGHPLSGGKLYSYIAGTTTLQNTYSDVALTIPNANPVILDAAGRATVFLTPGASYKFVLQDSSAASVWTQDNILAVPVSTAGNATTGTAGEAISAGNAVYLSDGTGGKNAGQWYKTDSTNAYSSTLPSEVGIAISAIASGGSGTITMGGQVTGLSALTIGKDYYLSTAGAITITAPTNARLLGRADSTSSLVLGAPPMVPPGLGIVNGRLTLTSGTPVTTGDVTGAASIFFTPYQGNQIALFDGSAQWKPYQFAELTLALGTLTSGLPYDVFLYDNAGTLTLESLAWTNGTTRATALTTQNGVLLKSGATTRRYLGTFYTTATTTTEDSALKRDLWNYYNRIDRELRRQESNATWNYTTATWRQANASASNQVEVVIGVAEVNLKLTASSMFANTNASVNAAIAIGEDSTTTPLDTGVGGTGSSAVASANAFAQLLYTLTRYPAIGRHFYAWMEFSGATGTTTFVGNGGQTGNTHIGGMVGLIPG